MTDDSKIDILITIPFSESLLEPLRQISPRIQILVDAARSPEEISNTVWEKIQVLYTDSILPQPEQVPNLRWLQLHYAGVDEVLGTPLFQKPQLEITNLSGAAAPQMAEYILMMLLALAHRMPELHANQFRAEWPRDRWDRFMPRELRGSTVGIVGYGSIGREVARLLQMLDITVLAIKRDVRQPRDLGYTVAGMGDPGGDLFHRLYPVQALQSMLKECDYVVVCLPLTSQTHGLIDDKMLRALKPSAFLVDVGRGGVIDQDALLLALQERRLAGVALDVFAEEPLPANSPFWKLPNAIVTPHVSGISPLYRQQALSLFETNLVRFLNGESLLNRLDLQREY
ncbi:MAG: D-2-hydroxyacid dehydrogenase [Anaerolineaceae bacterium]|nr:D-2-hydroxyacid dehydrogenase [Anaerolineaceae bacterium]